MSALGPTSIAILLAFTAAPLQAQAPAGAVRRLAVVVGANHGVRDRVPLRYAVRDAERFSELVTRMGGVDDRDSFLLREPSRLAFDETLSRVSGRAKSAKAGGGRVEVLLYFSGHADERGLMLGPETFSYAELRAAIGALGADVGITILDACAAGAITRLKGGRTHPAFLTAGSSEARGYAFLTSSSESEVAQESERLKGSFFTHALLTGLRGAGDVSGDGLVSLGEAYQFAFSETLSQTATTQAGAQHPAYDIKMAGTGDVVLTDVRQTSSRLVLGPEYDGRFFVLNASRHLVAELYKPQGRPVELGLEPGEYDVYFEEGQQLLATSVRLADGQSFELARRDLRPSRRQPTRRRGGPEGDPGRDLLDGRTRGQLWFGLSKLRDSGGAVPDDVGATVALAVTHWIRRDLAFDFTLAGFDLGEATSPAEKRSHALLAPLVGMRYYPPLSGTVRPYLAGGVGPFLEVNDSSPTGSDASNTTTEFKGGGVVGGGVEFFLWRRATLSIDARVTLVSGRSGEFHVAFGFGWTIGRGRP